MSRRVSRRALLGAGAAFGTTGCDEALSALARLVGERVPERFEPAMEASLDATHALLARATFGVRPGDLARARALGKERWVDEQLEPERISDGACELRTTVIDTIHLPPSLAFEFPPEQVELELGRNALLRAVYSRRQLAEVMVELWSDHFNIAISKGLCKHLKTTDDREVIRRHSLGRFRELLGASARSPAMLVYLDGRENKKEKPGDVPNENYARELFELHTLGLHGGYTQRDVMEAARCLTGWVVREEWAAGEVVFVPERHDDGEKVVLGQTFAAGGGRADLDRLLDLVASHPSTARHVATRLCKGLVADEPPASIVGAAGATFSSSKGDLRATVRSILLSDELVPHLGQKLKRPFRLVVSALRALAAETHGRGRVLEAIARMGQRLHSWPTPDGYPQESDAWLGTLLWRWKLALALAEDRAEGVAVPWEALRRGLGGADFLPRMAAHLFGRAPTVEELGAVSDYQGTDARKLALLLSSPAFQVF